jgi:hypothetical protein
VLSERGEREKKKSLKKKKKKNHFCRFELQRRKQTIQQFVANKKQ